jgi:steroid delta-isomerase-like uncharacterized protein
MSNRQAFGRAIRCFADPQRRQEYFSLYSDGIIVYGYPGVEPGLASVKRFYNAFWQVFPDARVTVHELVEEGEALVVRYVITGTQREAFMGVAASGQKIEIPGISVLHFKDGQCFERWACSDSLVLLSQLRGPQSPTS